MWGGEVCWRVGKGCGERNGGGVGKCVRVWGPTPQHIFLRSPHLPSPSESVAKLPCDKVFVAKLLATLHRLQIHCNFSHCIISSQFNLPLL